MGRVVDETRPTRFPPSGARDVSSQQKNFRELEQQILELDRNADAAAEAITTQATLIADMQETIATMQSQITALINAVKKLGG